MLNRYVIGAVGAVLVAMVLLTLMSPAPPTELAFAARPTTVPTYVGVMGDKVSASEGGVFWSGIAIEGNEDEVQFSIIPYANATASVMEIQNSSGTPVWYINTSGNVATAGTLGVTGNTTLGGDVTVDDDLIIDPQAGTIAVTDDSTITALGTVTKLSAAASCGTATITAGTAGQVLILMGPAANTITITDTGTLKLSGNCALTANDTLTMISDGTNWNEVSCNDNG